MDILESELSRINEERSNGEVDGDADGDDRDEERRRELGRKPRGFGRGIFKAASIQDKMLEKVISQMIPLDDGAQLGQVHDTDVRDDSMLAYAERPGFTVTAMSNNFRRFNARIGVVFKFQARMIRLFSWRKPAQTLSLLAVHTFLCLDPYLVCVLPLAVVLVGIFIPAFIARHPAPSSASDTDRVRNLGYSPRGPPLAPPPTVRPVKELSRDFFRNMGDLQNSMDDFSTAHDKIVALIVPLTNFSDEALSSALFVLLCAASVFMSIAAHLLPWRFLALAVGWAAICSGHPAVGRLARRAQKEYMGGVGATQARAQQTMGLFDEWVRGDIILDEAPEAREVEIFELQRRDGGEAGEWEGWLFSPSPYDPLSAARIAGERPRGARYFEDVHPPKGWEWSEKKWALDLLSREWVEERIITGVEVETEGERWVYDMYNESETAAAAGMGGGSAEGPVVQAPAGFSMPSVSWEEGEEGLGRRGEWRRRRWTRIVQRVREREA